MGLRKMVTNFLACLLAKSFELQNNQHRIATASFESLPQAQGQLNTAVVPSEGFSFIIASAYSSLASIAGGFSPSLAIRVLKMANIEARQSFFLVDLTGFEPATSSLRTRRSPN